MKVLVQWARDVPGDWVEIDSSAWSGLAKRSVPVGGESLDSDGYICALNVQGEIWDGFDHYRLVEVKHPKHGPGIKVTAWCDDPDDFAKGEKYAREACYFRYVPRPELGGAISPHTCHTVWAEPTLHGVLEVRYPEGSKTTLAEVVDLTADWTVPADDEHTRHGVWVSDLNYDAHQAAQTTQGWRSARWCDHLDPAELNKDGTLKGQRGQGRYVPLEHTRTYYHSSTALSNGIYVATHENELSLGTGTVATQSDIIDNGDDQLGWVGTTPANEPDSAAWPTGTYRAQLDVVTAGVNLLFGLLTVGGSDGGFTRVDSGLTTELERNVQAEAAFSGTGLHLATYTGAWTAGNQTDRLSIVLAVENTAGMMGSETLELDLNEADDFVDGDWPGPPQTAVAGVTSGAWSAPGPSVSPGPVASGSKAGFASWDAVAPAVQPGPITGLVKSGFGRWSAVQATAELDPEAGAKAGFASWDARSASVQPGPVSSSAGVTSGAWTGQPASVTTTSTAIAAVASGSWAGQSASIQPGPVSAGAQGASGSWTAPVAGVDSTVLAPARRGFAQWIGKPAQALAGPVSAQAGAVSGAWGAPATPALPGPVSSVGALPSGTWGVVATGALPGLVATAAVAGTGRWKSRATSVVAGAATANATASSGSWDALAPDVSTVTFVSASPSSGSWAASSPTVQSTVDAPAETAEGTWSGPPASANVGPVTAGAQGASGVWDAPDAATGTDRPTVELGTTIARGIVRFTTVVQVDTVSLETEA